MKKTAIALIYLIAGIISTSAKTAEELRIYINPGHGGWTADDRPCQLVNHPDPYSSVNTDTCSFFESNTDLEKGFGLLQRLAEYGLKFDPSKNQTGSDHTTGAARDLEQNIVMSRVKNGPYLENNKTEGQYGGSANTPKEYYWYNRNLTDIAEEVQVNNFDMFISIHSNASNNTAINYPLFLYRGYDDCHQAQYNDASHQQTSRAMAEACWDYGYENSHSMWTHFQTGKYIKGDLDFYGDNGVLSTRSDGTKVYGYLGALRHSVPGFLVEGYFHSYSPARHRAMNWDVCRVEGIAYAHGIADYFGLQKESYGTIYGIVRDAETTFSHAQYQPVAGSDDVYKPINGALVSLISDGETVAEYFTDQNYNGAFVFDGLAPGNYELKVEHPDYADYGNTMTVEVKAASVAYPKMFLKPLPPYRKTGIVYGLETLTDSEGLPLIRYSLSEDFAKVELLLVPASSNFEEIDENKPEVYVYEMPATRGRYEFQPEIASTHDYKWAVRYTTFANNTAGEIYSDASGLSAVRGGVVPITDSRYAAFGYTIVGHGNNNGFDIYDPKGTKVESRIWKGNPLWGSPSTTSSYDPCRGNERDGKAVFASWGDGACGLVAIDLLSEVEPESLYAGTMQPGGHYIYEGRIVGGGVPGFCFLGEGEQTMLYAFSEDHEGKNGNGATENSVVRYTVGNDWKLFEAPEVIGHKQILGNTNVDMIAYGNGFFAAQNRSAGNNTETYPGFIYVEAETHTVTYNSGTSLKSLNSCTTGIAITKDGKTLAVSDLSGINVYDVEWNQDTPAITYSYSITTAKNPDWINMRFDAAGNLHTYQVNDGGYHVYALRKPAETLMVEGPESFAPGGDYGTGIDNVKTTESSEETVYFTLTGIQVSEKNLTPGIYIRVTGRKAEKIIINN